MIYRISTLSLFLLMAGCIPTSVPVGNPEKAKPDDRLVGKWEGVDFIRSENKVEITIEKAEEKLIQQGLPKGFMKATVKQLRNNKTNTYYFFITKIGKDDYLNVFNQGKDILKIWNKKKPNREMNVFLMKYSVAKDKATIQFTDLKKISEDIENGVVEGKKHFLNVTADKVIKYINDHRKGLYESTRSKKFIFTRKK